MIWTRRDLLAAGCFTAAAAAADPPGFRFVDVTSAAGLGSYRHDNRASGKKYLPETLGPGCAFLDYDGDGWQDILLLAPLTLLHNNRDGTFRNVTRASGLEMLSQFALGVAVGDFDNDGFPDVLVTCVGQNRLFRNTGRGTFVDVTNAAGLMREGFSTSAMWVDYDRDGLLDLFVCNYVKWSPETDVFCSSAGGKQKSYCTPEAYRGTTCWLYRNLGNGKFEDMTAKAGIFDSSSKSLGVTQLDLDNDGWPDIFVANDTQPNKLYRNLRNGKFEEVGVAAGVAFSDDGKARAGMGVDAADLDDSGLPTLMVTNFQNEMLGLYRASGGGAFSDIAARSEVGRVTRRSLGFGCFFFDVELDGALELLVVNGHIDDTIRGTEYAQSPHLFLNRAGKLRDVAAEIGAEFARPKVGRGAAFGDFDNDGDLDVLVTSNGGGASLYRNDVGTGNRSLRLRLVGTKSNRDGIGATVRIEYGGRRRGSRTVKSGGSYLSQSELPVTFGLGRAARADRVVVQWPSGRVEEQRNVDAGRYVWTEERGYSRG
ncbi:MAG: CRTAC1 family protein [Bryobacteraceae bacterium]|nr:CRTAC1 family protein [Bryobacteraceae bacterium]